MDIHERLAIFYDRLRVAPPALTAHAAFEMICRVLEGVETEFCRVVKLNPPPRYFVGRMYPPEPDSIQVRVTGDWWIKVRRHRILIKPDGSFCIFRLRGPGQLAEEFRKPGARL